MTPIIKIDGIGKQYKVGTRSFNYTTLRETVGNLSRRSDRRKEGASNTFFWALRDVSFDVYPGEIVGIIGRNGAGKSTLLKILARVTEPTEGRIELFGHTNSLLEVGTGFHPELTGRENVFVNGAILGMKTPEIRNIFDEIVAFAEVDKFIDTPVKHYSSGMYMRLAFSVAAHLNPDILIIDEVLSVGDAQFQKKCLGKVQDVASAGRTVLFVSHNMAAVQNLCQRGVVLDNGRVTYVGRQTAAITHYLERTSVGSADFGPDTPRSGMGGVRIDKIEISDSNSVPLSTAMSGQDINISFHFNKEADFARSNVVIGFMVRTYTEVPVFLQHNRLTRDHWVSLPQSGTFRCSIKQLPLPPSSYRIAVSVMCDDEYLDRIDDACELTVIEGDFYGSGEVPPITHGCCLVNAEWSLLEDAQSV